MIPHDILTLYAAKPIEYLIAVSFLLLFVPFWRFVQGGPAAQRAVATKRALVPRLLDWFSVPELVHLHPGHAWARVEANGYVTVGMDDFAHKLTGQVAGVRLPVAGAHVGQGEPGWTLLADNRCVDMLSPVDGIVVETNPLAVPPGGVQPDPYGEGWLLKVKPTRLAANLKNLAVDGAARRLMSAAADQLRDRLAPELGLVYQDGGVPVHGIARELDPEHWHELAQEFFLTKDSH